MEDVVNPAVPSTVGALLAEEWTINPLATLPSFLEMFMMDEASRLARKSLDVGMRLLQQQLQNQHPHQQAATNNENYTTNDSNTANTSRSFTRIMAHLSSLLQRSTSKVASTIALLIHKFGPELSCLILYAVERQCLHSEACATFSESLYGGRQAKLDHQSSQDDNKERRKLLPVSDRDKTRLALLVALGPYIQRRMLLLYQHLKQQQQQQQQQQPSHSERSLTATRFSLLLQKLRKFYVGIYPFLHVSLSSIDVVYQWRYLLGRSVFFHPYGHLLGLVVRRVTQADNETSPAMSVSASSTAKVPPSNSSSSSATTTSDLSNVPPSVAPSSPLRNVAVWALSSTVVLSWISHFRAEYRRQRQELILQQQQLQQQQQQQVDHRGAPTSSNNLNDRLVYNSNATTQDVVPLISPTPSSGIKNNKLIPDHLCPSCRQPRMHPTASSSGFVFCYKCLLQHVRDTGKCPMTGRHCREAQMLRLYEPNATTATTIRTSTATVVPGSS